MDLGEPDRGCQLLADISGYTEYMGGNELMHAQDVVADLLETIVHTIEPVFTVSRLEGDAAFAGVLELKRAPMSRSPTVDVT